MAAPANYQKSPARISNGNTLMSESEVSLTEGLRQVPRCGIGATPVGAQVERRTGLCTFVVSSSNHEAVATVNVIMQRTYESGD